MGGIDEEQERQSEQAEALGGDLRLPGATARHCRPNTLEIVQGRGFFAIALLYEPTECAINKTWVPGDI